jgi:hypothetical protein
MFFKVKEMRSPFKGVKAGSQVGKVHARAVPTAGRIRRELIVPDA